MTVEEFVEVRKPRRFAASMVAALVTEDVYARPQLKAALQRAKEVSKEPTARFSLSPDTMVAEVLLKVPKWGENVGVIGRHSGAEVETIRKVRVKGAEKTIGELGGRESIRERFVGRRFVHGLRVWKPRPQFQCRDHPQHLSHIWQQCCVAFAKSWSARMERRQCPEEPHVRRNVCAWISSLAQWKRQFCGHREWRMQFPWVATRMFPGWHVIA